MSLAAGTKLGPYEILELAGAGGMGEVYKARDSRLHRIVALKLASDRLGDDPQLRARFQREARAVAALNHPHICAIHDVASADGHDFIVMEFLDGETLEQRLSRGPLPLPELFQVAIAIADAMVAAHREGIIHRDLKPSNVMLTRSGPKLLDFGIAKQRDLLRNGSTSAEIDATGTSAATLEGTLIGTAPYMAPEQLEGRPVDVRTDIFAFGSLLFEMATGKRAFHGASTAALVAAILAEPRPLASESHPAVPRILDRIISACLARNPDDRWQSATDLLRELRWGNQDLGETSGASGTARGFARWRVHVSWAAALLAVVAGLWLFPRAGPGGQLPPNPQPVIVLMDSPLPGRVYDPRTAAEGGTNADDVTDALRGLPVSILKENTSAVWRREEQVIGENPDLIVSHLSCLLDARVGADQPTVSEHLSELSYNRLLVFFAYVAARNPRTRFIIYSRSVFQRHGGEQQWVAIQEARLPVLRNRLHAFIVPGGQEHASFRQPETAQLLRARVTQVLSSKGT
jgi:tRNA A-37 threonylcarbamoyl transferase component Bud32